MVTPQQRNEMFEAIAEALAPTERGTALPVNEPHWPARGPLVPVVETGGLERHRAEQRELEAQRQAARERDSEQRQERAMAQKMQSDQSWNEWADRKIAKALATQGFNKTQTEAIGMTLSQIRAELRKEFEDQLAQLRAELVAATRSDKSPTVIDLPARRHDAVG